MKFFPLREDHVQAGKRFFLQILNTSLAVIIALAFEGLVERKRIHDLVATAVEHMRSELRENRQDFRTTIAELERRRGELEQTVAFLDKLVAAHEARAAGRDPESVQGGVSVRSMQLLLAATSRSTAEATGALGHMPYAQVKRFAEAYSYQQVVQETMNRWHQQTSTAVSLLKTDLTQVPLADLRELRTCLATAQRLMVELSKQAPTLVGLYDRALSGG